MAVPISGGGHDAGVSGAGSSSIFDLDACKDKPSYTASKCPGGSAVACWSATPSRAWSCWSQADAPAWATSSLKASMFCQASERGHAGGFDGACTLVTPAYAPAPAPALAEPLAWEVAYEQAKQTLAKMNAGEKHTLLQGVGWGGWTLNKWWYVGNTGAIPRLNIPSLNMEDAAGGFRTYWNEIVGTVTCWPSLLSLASTWNPTAVQEFAVALGREFRGKGANGILGPSIDVHRVSRGGRNFEFLSGEDPYLGSKFAHAYVTGVQSQGVFAVMKHWVFDSQETNRGSESSVVDDKTAWELYYPPFKAAVDAGVSAAMCSYNKINGVWSCSNQKQLQHVLKGQMGFKGFVQSDWWAAHATSLGQGLDQEMPGAGTTYFNGPQIAGQSQAAVDAAVTRVLAVVHRMNLTHASGCAPPKCKSWMVRNVTSPSHGALARTLAREAVVLLQNKGAVLPLSARSVRTIAVIGSVAVATPFNPNGNGQGGGGSWATGDYYSGGGSGHVVAGHWVDGLDGIRARAALGGMRVITSVTNDVNSGVAAAKKADVAIVVAGTTSGESMDRANLNLDNNADHLIAQVAQHAKHTIVLVQASGAVLMPWRNSVDGILTLFLGGQATGSAWADILFGDYAPTGRLPVMIPVSESDTIPPNGAATVTYTEGMATSYRNPKFKAAFPFGHGLTYTAFKYLSPSAGPCDAAASGVKASVFCIRIPVENVGRTASRAVPQLYLSLQGAGQPAPLLKGFERSGVILPGSSVVATFALTAHDFSFYDASAGRWMEASAGTAHIGESSADIRQTLPLSRDAGGAWKPGQPSGRNPSIVPISPASAPRPAPLPLPLPAAAPAATPAPAPAAMPAPAPVAVPEPAPAPAPIRVCSAMGEDCAKTQCCSAPGMSCFMKDQWWAACNLTCTPGIHMTEEKQFRTPWSCQQLGSKTPWSGQPGGPREEQVVLRFKASEVPDSWRRGTMLTVGSGRQQLRGEVVRIDQGQLGGGGVSSLLSFWPWVVVFIVGVMVAMAVCLNDSSGAAAAEGEGNAEPPTGAAAVLRRLEPAMSATSGALRQVSIHAAEVSVALWQAGINAVAPMVGQLQGAEPAPKPAAPAASQAPSPLRRVPSDPRLQGSPTHRPLMCY